jgi:hypothetical protein
MLTAKLPRIDRFNGLNNVTDPVRLGLGWLLTADNVNITDTGAIARREGYTLVASGAYTSAYSTQDFSRMYCVVGDALKAMAGTSVGQTLLSGLDDAPMYWTEVNGQVFFNNGTDSGIIKADHSLIDWEWDMPAAPGLAAVTGNLPAGLYRACTTAFLADGRETGASDHAEIELAEGQALQITGTGNVYICPANSTVFQLAGEIGGAMVWNASPDDLGRELMTDNMGPLPACDVVQHWKGRIYAAQHMPASDQTAIWFSQPLGFHLFDQSKDFIIVPGQVNMLAPTATAIVIGTDRGIYAYDGKNLTSLADYGTVPGQHWADDETRTLFWSRRGLCAALPFANLTDKQVSVAPGVRTGGTIVRGGGQRRFLVAIQQGGDAFNSYS